MTVADATESAGFLASGSLSQDNVVVNKSLTRDQRIREAALLCFSDSSSNCFVNGLIAKEWEELLSWLDVSGLALYFLDRMSEIGQRSSLPVHVVNRLEASQEQNRERTQGLFDESVRVQHDFQSAQLSYAVMKGISLYPLSVPRPELRHQFDLDFLIAESDAVAAKRILERHGYTLFAISGRSWEFKKGQTPRVTRKDLYRDLPYRGVELHLESKTSDRATQLHRAVFREVHNVCMPVLSPVDLFLGQAMHVSKDISSPFLRASHLLEFYRHVLAKREDMRFWEELRLRAQEDRCACLAIGMATHLITPIWGDFAPHALTSWTVDQLPRPIRLWLDLYGRTAILQAPPGSKRYLWLRQELVRAGGVAPGSPKASLLSIRMPSAVIKATPGEALSTRAARYRLQIRFLISRARFHVIEGLRFIVESHRWNRVRSGMQ